LAEPHSDYTCQLVARQQLSDADLARCVAIIGDGGAVTAGSAKQGLARALALVIVRRDGEIVAVGAIKRPLSSYVARVAKKAGYEIPRDAHELGYVAVDLSHRGSHLSTRIVRCLREGGDGRLFATTDEPKMKTVLTRAGFQRKGDEWTGQRGRLSLWVTD
jgi:hypothetical protein